MALLCPERRRKISSKLSLFSNIPSAIVIVILDCCLKWEYSLYSNNITITEGLCVCVPAALTEISHFDTELVFNTEWNESQLQLIPSNKYPVYKPVFWIRNPESGVWILN